MDNRRPVRRAGGETRENVPEIEFSTRSERMVSLRLSSFCWASCRGAWTVRSKLAIVSFGERRCQKYRVTVAMDILECCPSIRKSSIVSSRHPSAGMG